MKPELKILLRVRGRGCRHATPNGSWYLSPSKRYPSRTLIILTFNRFTFEGILWFFVFDIKTYAEIHFSLFLLWIGAEKGFLFRCDMKYFEEKNVNFLQGGKMVYNNKTYLIPKWFFCMEIYRLTSFCANKKSFKWTYKVL